MEKINGIMKNKHFLIIIILLIMALVFSCKENSGTNEKNKLNKEFKLSEIKPDIILSSKRSFLIKGIKDTVLIKAGKISKKYLKAIASNSMLWSIINNSDEKKYIIKPIKANHECIIMIYYTKDSSYFLGKKVYNVRDSI